MFNNLYPENRAVYDIMKNLVEPERPRMTVMTARCVLDK
jgi:hypothetical protein